MRALQSRTTAGLSSSGALCRTQQFAALRYVSRRLETDAAAGLAFELPRFGSSSLEDAGLDAERVEPVWIELEPLGGSATLEISPLELGAEELLQVIRCCNGMLADPTILFAERSHYAAEFQLLRHRGLELMEQFLSSMEGRNDPGAPGPRGIRLEEGAAGWIASC